MKRMENNAYLNQYNENQEQNGTYLLGSGWQPEVYYKKEARVGNAVLKLLLMAAMATIVVMANVMIRTESTAGSNIAVGETTVTPSVVETSREETVVSTAVETVTEITEPINEKFSCRGNFYEIFTQQNNVVDNLGNVYETAFVARAGSNALAKKITYQLDGSYTKLRGTIALAEEDKDQINFFWVCVYNENGDCIYKSNEISDKSLDPIEVNCNISGMSKVTIELVGCDRTCGSVVILMPNEGFVFVKPDGSETVM